MANDLWLGEVLEEGYAILQLHVFLRYYPFITNLDRQPDVTPGDLQTMSGTEQTPATPFGPEQERITAANAYAILRGRLELYGEKRDGRPVIVYDLDATLFDNRPRVIQILKDTLKLPEAQALVDSVRETISGITKDNLKYLLKETLNDHGVMDPEVTSWFQDRWFERFFTNEYVLFDEPLRGAVDFVQRLHDDGAMSIYLTGRDTPGMRKGTLQALANAGFPDPDGETCHLITKPTFEQPDPEFKYDAIEIIGGLGEVIGVFDNEPKPMNVLAGAFPDAEAFFLDTMHSPDVEPILPKIRVMQDFKI